MTDRLYYQQLQAGAEYLAQLASDLSDRAAHLKMAGIYWLQARQAGDADNDAMIH